ncbi:hypothetical protein [Streptomyces cadmiisoli]|uniref:hypothetical protein n=1 Tax=Streptomyces cadmiisoli TaxID=2184053 RepID=UPI003649ED0B
MFRIIRWPLLALYLLVVGLWPAAATPVAVAAVGAVAVLAVIPAPLWLALGAVVAWETRHRSATPKRVSA